MLWNVDNSECLQNLSNIFVNALYELRNPNQPIPSWVRALPDPPRSEMIQMVKDYGSPNVFSFFAPQYVLPFAPIILDLFKYATLVSQWHGMQWTT